MIVGVVIEALCTVSLFIFDEGISRAQQSKIIALETQLLEVSQRTADRDITPYEMNTLSKKLALFPGQPAKIVVFPVNFESVAIAMKVWGVLLNAHWAAPPPERLLAPPHDLLTQGILVEYSDDEGSRKAADALVNGLTSMTNRSRGKYPKDQFDPTKPLVWIFVGDRPTPLRSWVTP